MVLIESLANNSLLVSPTQRMQSLLNLTALLGASNRHSTVHGRRRYAPVEHPSARALKRVFNASSKYIKTSSVLALMSILNWTVPGTVFTLPGWRVRMPVLTRARCLCAMGRDWAIILAAASIASARLVKSVVPVWHSRPRTVTVCHR